MSSAIRLLLICFVLLLLLAAGAWWYLLGPNTVAAAELVPADTVAFATIPNAAKIVIGYQSSDLKKVIDSPNMKPLTDAVVRTLGQKNIDLFQAFLPSLSGQSFLALTHFDYEHPGQAGLIAAMKPKPGSGNFDDFVEKLKAAYPSFIKEGTTGTGSVAGVDYQWIKGPGSEDKICVAKYKGWIVTTWGEATLQDWIERLTKKSASPSLAQSPDYQKLLEHIGPASMAITYLNYHAILDIMQKQMSHIKPGSGDYLTRQFGQVGGLAIGSGFEKGVITDRFAFAIPHQAQISLGMSATPCPFDTLKFTGPDTLLYFAYSMDWKQYAKNIEEQMKSSPVPNPILDPLSNSITEWAKSENIDVQHNIVDTLGGELSVQSEWSPDTNFPDVGIILKIDKPEDFKPVIDAILDTARKNYGSVGQIMELNAPGQKFAALQFVQTMPISPTITEDGPYFGFFLTENHAVRAFSRNPAGTLANNDDFNRQIGDKRNGSSQIVFLDTPKLVEHAYKTALPYVSMASMFNPTVASLVKGHDLPPDATWLAPIGTWSLVVNSDADFVTGYSVSGIGNQGILLGFTGGVAAGVAQSMGVLPRITPPPSNGMPPNFTPATSPSGLPPSPAPGTPDNTLPQTAPTPSPEPAAPETSTNAATPDAAAPTPVPSPEATTAPAPAAPTPAPETTPAPDTSASPAPTPAGAISPDATPTPTPETMQ